MTTPTDLSEAPPRRPRVFAPDDPALVTPSPIDGADAGRDDFADDAQSEADDRSGTNPATRATTIMKHGFGWGALFLSAMLGLASLAASVSFARFVSQALARNDWVGWTSTGLLALAAIAALVIVIREVFGLFRLARLGRLRRDANAALASNDKTLERSAVRDLRAHGIRAGLFRPITLWPFPIDALRKVASHARRFVVVEASAGQLEDELRLALSHGGVGQGVVIDSVRRMGGVLPGQKEIVERVLTLEGAAS